MTPTSRMLFVVNDASFFLSHRLPIALEAQRRGFDVHVATPPGPVCGKIRELGFMSHTLPLLRSSQNILSECCTLTALVRLFRSIRPDIVHLVTIKPVIYGGIAARITKVSAVVAAISGLGTVFLARGAKASLIKAIVISLYRLALGHSNIRVIFQNRYDRSVFVQQGIVPETYTTLIPGSGIDLNNFCVEPEPINPMVVTMASRLLRDKGVVEFVAAAKLVRSRWSNVTFQLIGDIDLGNRTSLTEAQYRQIETEGDVDLLGHREDIPQLFARSNIVVLPSYREGLPKVLVEAAGSARAIVTTDVPGCRDAIIAGKTGILVPVADVRALVEAIEDLLQNSEKRAQMGTEGRRLAERTFAIETIIDQHFHIYAELLGQRGNSL